MNFLKKRDSPHILSYPLQLALFSYVTRRKCPWPFLLLPCKRDQSHGEELKKTSAARRALPAAASSSPGKLRRRGRAPPRRGKLCRRGRAPTPASSVGADELQSQASPAGAGELQPRRAPPREARSSRGDMAEGAGEQGGAVWEPAS